MNNNHKANSKVQHLRNPDDELWKEVKVAAIRSGKTITEWVEDALRKQLPETDKPKRKRASSTPA